MLLALVLCVGCAAATDKASAPPSPEEAIAQTLAGLSKVIRSAKVGPQPNESSSPSGIWLHIEVASANQMEGQWEATLLAGAVADRTAGKGLLASVIKGYIVDVVPSDGNEPTGQPTNEIDVAGERFQPPGDDDTIRRATADTLARFGAQPVSVEVLHPLDAALMVVATIATPEAMNGRLGQLQTELIGTPIHYEGVYLEVRLPDGTPIAKLWTTYRNVVGAQWVRPDLAEILGGPSHG